MGVMQNAVLARIKVKAARNDAAFQSVLLGEYDKSIELIHQTYSCVLRISIVLEHYILYLTPY